MTHPVPTEGREGQQHTPGPWRVHGINKETGSISIGPVGGLYVIADVTNAASFGEMLAGAMKRGSGRFDQKDGHTQWANARLIAAAPELLAALKEARLQIEYLDAKFQPTGTSANVLARIESAIAKAEGR